MSDLVCVGAIAGAFGVRGEVRLKSFTADPTAIAEYAPLTTEDGARSFDLDLGRPVKGGFAARLSGVMTKEQADDLRGVQLFAPRDRLPDLPDDEYYHADLIGVEVFDTGGAPLGRVVSVDLATMRFGGFTFLGSPEPARPWPFLAPAMLRPDDLVIELRDAAEAPCPITPEALRLPMEEVPGLTPAPGQRLVLCCASGLRAWRAGLTLKAQGIENMSIIAAKACA